MRYFYYPVLFFLLVSFFASCTRTNVSYIKNDIPLQQLSAELENLPSENLNGFSENAKPVVIEDTSQQQYFFEKHEPAKMEKAFTIKQKNIIRKEARKAGEIFPWVDRDNIFWKIGNGMLKVGGLVMSIFGGVYISSYSGHGGITFGLGLIIGLAVMLLALVFFLIAIISTYMKNKKNSHPPVKNADEI